MRADIDIGLGIHRHVDQRARRGDLGHRRNPRRGAPHRIAKRLREGRGQQRVGVFLLAGEADDSALAVTLDLVGTHRGQHQLRHLSTNAPARRDQRCEILDIAADMRIRHHRQHRHLAERRRGRTAGLLEFIVHDGQQASDRKIHWQSLPGLVLFVNHIV